MPITIPQGVTVKVDGNVVTVKGPKGELKKSIEKSISFEEKDGKLYCKRPDDSIFCKMNHGTARAIVADMVKGVTEGFSKELLIKGVGYRAEMQGKDLVMHLGHTHPDIVKAVEGVEISVNTKEMSIKVEGIDKQLVGQVAATIRAKRKPECYHGKGVRYKGEVVVLRQPASAKKTAAGAAAPAK
jgi:large subunit ribosomal protein L6